MLSMLRSSTLHHRSIAASLKSFGMSRCETLQQDVRTLQELRDELEQLSSQNTDLIAINADLNSAIDVLREESNDLMDENTQLRIDRDNASWRNEQLTQRLVAIQRRFVRGEIVEIREYLDRQNLVPAPPPNTPPPLRVGVDFQMLVNENHTLRETLDQMHRALTGSRCANCGVELSVTSSSITTVEVELEPPTTGPTSSSITGEIGGIVCHDYTTPHHPPAPPGSDPTAAMSTEAPAEIDPGAGQPAPASGRGYNLPQPAPAPAHYNLTAPVQPPSPVGRQWVPRWRPTPLQIPAPWGIPPASEPLPVAAAARAAAAFELAACDDIDGRHAINERQGPSLSLGLEPEQPAERLQTPLMFQSHEECVALDLLVAQTTQALPPPPLPFSPAPSLLEPDEADDPVTPPPLRQGRRPAPTCPDYPPPECVRCIRPRHSEGSALGFEGFCCWACCNNKPWHGHLCGNRPWGSRRRRRRR